MFGDNPLKFKNLRKYFSQSSDRRKGPTTIQKIFMEHSLETDIDLMLHNSQNEEDFIQIFNKEINEKNDTGVIWKKVRKKVFIIYVNYIF